MPPTKPIGIVETFWYSNVLVSKRYKELKPFSLIVNAALAPSLDSVKPATSHLISCVMTVISPEKRFLWARLLNSPNSSVT